MSGEFELIADALAALGHQSSGVVIGSGDDCALFATGSWPLCTVDTLVEGIHWDPRFSSPEDVGFKLLAVNLSDIASMGGSPGPFLLACTLAGPSPASFFSELLEGIAAARDAHGLDASVVAPIGGDMTRSPDRAVLTLTLFGRPTASQNVLRRSGARAGDGIWVTGPLGAAAAGLALLQSGVAQRGTARCLSAHRRPRARLDLATFLSQTEGVHACIDLSDGIAGDARHVAAASGLGIEIELELVPIGEATQRAAEILGRDPLAWALGGGEDFELLVAAATSAEPMLASRGLVCVGRAVDEPGLRYVRNGRPVRTETLGFDHFRDLAPKKGP